VFRNELVVPKTDTRITILSSEASTKDGYNPTVVLFDEVHAQPDAELWDAMALGMGARIEPIMIGITTAGKRYDRHGQDTLCYRLYEYGIQVAKGEVVDPTFYFTWWEPRLGSKANHLDPQVWAEANPGLGDLLSEEDLESVSRRTDEASFRTKRCNMWVSTKTAAIPGGKFEALGSDERPDGETTSFEGGHRLVPNQWLSDSVLFLDGSWSGDSTGVVGCTREGHLFVVCNYEKRAVDGDEWRVPVNSVKQDVKIALDAGARVLLLDPYRWQQTAEDLADEGLPVVEWPTGSLPRIIPAWKDYYAAVMDGDLSHDGDLALVRHHDNMVLRVDS
jgi:phage terminase large subunit-like protein